ncbi:MAG: sensor histidine kinase [Pyrinomonadaceae bacterium]|nr:sensor histidine kinase [Sphingobacteriaceae bacterium]
MKLRELIFVNALVVALSLALINFYFQRDWYYFFIAFGASLIICYGVFYYLIERYVYSKIKLIYKLIHNLKLGKDIKDAIGDYVSKDPINDVEHEVKEWARDKKIEIEALKNQEQFRREFLANISHEFKTPLFAIQGYIEAVIEDGLEDPDLANQFLNKASRNVDRLTLLVKDLDVISKLESGEAPINFEKFDIALLIKDVIEQMEHKAKSHKIELIFKEKYDTSIWVNADRDKICQVLINLIDNSIKYGKEEGFTAIKIFELHDQILVEVTDDGVGIEEKHLPRLFERFFRTEQSRSRQIGGSGLGLAIVKHILEAHEQTITVRSTEGLGSTFAFTLERVKPALIPE